MDDNMLVHAKQRGKHKYSSTMTNMHTL